MCPSALCGGSKREQLRPNQGGHMPLDFFGSIQWYDGVRSPSHSIHIILFFNLI